MSCLAEKQIGGLKPFIWERRAGWKSLKVELKAKLRGT